MPDRIDINELLEIVTRSLNQADENNYMGWDKMDAMNSPFLKAISFNNKYLKILYTQIVNRFPFELRKVLGVSKQFNPKAGGLVISSLCKMKLTTGDDMYIDRAYRVVDMLMQYKSERDELCWGYGHEWQSTAFHRAKYEPNAVATLYVSFALFDLYDMTNDENIRNMLKSIYHSMYVYFPILFENDDERAISYIEISHSGVILNIQALYSIFLVRYSRVFSDRRSLELARKHINYIISKKTEYNAWYYSEPSTKSIITHDSYHTGYILDSLLEYYSESKEERILKLFKDGYKFYIDNLFTESIEPKWMFDTVYPMDVHSAAQGILTFIKASQIDETALKIAEKLSSWAINNLFNHKENLFYYQKRRFMTYKHNLFRWNDAWMMHALTSLIARKIEISAEV